MSWTVEQQIDHDILYEQGLKKCTKCEKTKKFSNFSKDKQKSDGFNSKCKLCESEYRQANKDRIKDYRKANKEKQKIYWKDYIERQKLNSND